MLFTAACENTEPSATVRLEVETAVSGYLDALADAYSTLDVEVLEGHASPNEIAHVKKLLTELLQMTGDRIDAELIEFRHPVDECFSVDQRHRPPVGGLGHYPCRRC